MEIRIRLREIRQRQAVLKSTINVNQINSSDLIEQMCEGEIEAEELKIKLNIYQERQTKHINELIALRKERQELTKQQYQNYLNSQSNSL